MGRRKRRVKKWNIFFILVLIAGFVFMQDTSIVSNVILPDGDIRETNLAPEVLFCPADGCETRLRTLIESANVSIHCALYDVELEGIVDALKAKAKDIDVQLVTDKDNTKHLYGIDYVSNIGTHQLMHDKFCIIDSEIVFMGSYNPTITGMKNDNNMLVIYSKYLSSNYEDEFSELESRVFGSGEKVRNPVIYLNDIRYENYFCPEDKCAEHIIELISGATDSIDFMCFTFTHDGIGDALVDAHNRGVQVRGVFEKFQKSKWCEYEKLLENDVPVIWDSNPKNMHNKVFIIDKTIVVTGSFNPTKAGDTKNDENILIIHDKEIADKFTDDFERIHGSTPISD